MYKKQPFCIILHLSSNSWKSHEIIITHNSLMCLLGAPQILPSMTNVQRNKLKIEAINFHLPSSLHPTWLCWHNWIRLLTSNKNFIHSCHLGHPAHASNKIQIRQWPTVTRKPTDNFVLQRIWSSPLQLKTWSSPDS